MGMDVPRPQWRRDGSSGGAGRKRRRKCGLVYSPVGSILIKGREKMKESEMGQVKDKGAYREGSG